MLHPIGRNLLPRPPRLTCGDRAPPLAAGELGALVPGLDRDATAMVLAAVAHANGSHEHSGTPTPDPAARLVETGSGKRFSFALLPSLHPWPGLPRR